MKKSPGDFAHYLSVTNDAELWGVGVRAGGRITNEPGAIYPPAGHPADHAFDWEHGRVLGAWQVVWIEGGVGEFAARRGREVERVEAGDVIFITPGRWHRYRPAARTGWSEHWIELEGPVPGRLTEAGLLPANCGVLRGLDAETLRVSIGGLHAGIDTRGEDGGAATAAAGLRLLALLAGGNRRRDREDAPLVRAVRRAERLLDERPRATVSMPALARELGVGYAGFRREFKRRTGLAPGQYLTRLRLERAQRLLGATPATLELVSEAVGFSSAFHLSAAFKARFGVAPKVWRKGRSAD